MTNLDKLIAEATPLPWRRKRITGFGPPYNGIFGPPHPVDGGDYADILAGSNAADADLAAHAVNMLPKLVQALKAVFPHPQGDRYVQ